MTALAQERLTPFAGVIPTRGSFGIKANVQIFKGAMIALDSAGRAMPAGLTAGGSLYAVGKASASYDNRTTSATLSGSADACQVQVEFGTFGYVSATGGGDDITAANAGAVCYVKDDQTVALTNGTDTRCIAGYVTEVRNGIVYVQQGVAIASQIVIAADEASQLDTVQTQVAALIVDETSAQAQLNIPLTSALDVATGALLAVFANGTSTTPGTQLTNSKACSVRWNNDAAPGAVAITVAMPQDLNDAADVVFHALVSKTGATSGDATKLTVGAFEQTVGALHDADTDFGGDTSAVVGNATAKTVTEVTLALGLADVHATPSAMTFTIKPKAGTLGTDDLCLHACWLEYTRVERTS